MPFIKQAEHYTISIKSPLMRRGWQSLNFVKRIGSSAQFQGSNMIKTPSWITEAKVLYVCEDPWFRGKLNCSLCYGRMSKFRFRKFCISYGFSQPPSSTSYLTAIYKKQNNLISDLMSCIHNMFPGLYNFSG